MPRQPLPHRRLHETLEVEHWDQNFIVGIGRANERSPITEIFIHANKSGTQAETLAADSAVLLSIALQYSAPLEVLRQAITRNQDGTAAGPIGAILDRISETSKDD